MFLLKNLRNRAFTLPELVVVIAIVAILSTAAFISYSSFNIDARDSVRKADMGNMKVILRSTKQKNGSYPTPTGITTSISRWATSTGTLVAKQGKFLPDLGLENTTQTFNDPKTKWPYLYSVTKSGQEYQIAMTLETPVEWLTAYVEGDYRSVMASIPSLLVATGASILDIDISSNQSQYIVNGSVKNLPYDMTGVFQKKASTLSQASGTGGFVSSTTYTSCESIYEAGKSVGSGSYYIRNSSGALTQMGCVMNY